MDLDDGSSPWGDVPARSSSNPKDDESTPAESQPSTDPKPSSTVKSPTTSTPRGRPAKTVKRFGTQSVVLSSVDDALGPLGPLGDSFSSAAADEPPVPPQKEQQTTPVRSRAPGAPSVPSTSSSSLRGMMDSVNLDDDNEDEERLGNRGPRIPPPVQPPSGEQIKRATEPSVSVEQAAKPSFSIYVGDPHKVGDLTSSHTVYQVRTVTTSKAYRNPEFNVARRYRDFLWLYSQMHNNNPGVVVPPPPEKQAVGRFDAEFIESRRQALERMLNKIAAHPILQHDADLKLFLESESFSMDVKHKERKDPGLGESKGMLSSIGIGGGGGKFIEHDDWFHDRKVYLDALETQLKALLKATDTVVVQRRSLSEACGEFSASLSALAAVELSSSLTGPLEGLSDIQIRIKELYERQAQQDVLTLGIVIDEYIRLIGSVKTAFQQRQKAYHAWHSAESELLKRKNAQDKILRQGRSQQDRITQLQADVDDAERKVNQARLLFENLGKLMRMELERFEKEKVEDFKSGVETYLEGAVEAQKELIEIWETYLVQLDAEEDGVPFGAPAVPAGIVATPSLSGTTVTERPQTAESEETASHEE